MEIVSWCVKPDTDVPLMVNISSPENQKKHWFGSELLVRCFTLDKLPSERTPSACPFGKIVLT